MSSPKAYMAASVPRFLRQTRLGYLPLKCIIGSRMIRGDGGANLVFDVVMLPVQEFQRMRTNVGVQHVVSPALKAGPTFNPVFVLADSKKVIVPEGTQDPEDFARTHFLKIFGLLSPELPPPQPFEPESFEPDFGYDDSFLKAARDCTARSLHEQEGESS